MNSEVTVAWVEEILEGPGEACIRKVTRKVYADRISNSIIAVVKELQESGVIPSNFDVTKDSISLKISPIPKGGN